MLTPGDRPGQSAADEYRRARRAAQRRRPVSALLALLAFGVEVAGAGSGRPLLGLIGAGIGVLAWVARPEADPDRWRRGAAGEVATARTLAELPRRFVVLHDRRVPGSRANIDHVVIGPTGVAVVDSKAFRARLRVRRGRVLAGDHEVATEPARWEAERVAAELGVAVTPIVAVHGSGLRRRGKVVGGVRVVPADRICHWLRRGRRRLTRTEVSRLAEAAHRALPPGATPGG